MPRWISSTGTPQVCLQLAAVLVDDVLQVLRHAAGAVHHEVAIRQPAVDLFDAIHRQHFAGGLARELVRAVAGADGDGQRVDARFGDEPLGFVRIGEQLVVRQHAFGAVAVFLFAVARFERAEAAELAFDGNAAAWASSHTSRVTLTL